MLTELRTSAWAFLEIYGWTFVFATVFGYIIYNKYISGVLNNRKKDKELEEQKKYDKERAEKHEEDVKNARLRQQMKHDEQEVVERLKKEEKERIQREKILKETTVLNTAVGRFEMKKKIDLGNIKIDEKEKKKDAEEILEVLVSSKPIVIFTKSFCPFSRKIRQIIASYRLSSDVYEFYDLDEEFTELPGKQIQDIFENRYGLRSVPKMFINGEYIGGFEEIIEFSKNSSFEKALN